MGAKLHVLSKLAMRESENTSTCFGVKTSQYCRNLPKQSKLRALRALRALAIVNPITWCSHPCHKLLHWTSASTSKPQHIPLWCICALYRHLCLDSFFKFQTFWPTVQFSAAKICRPLIFALSISASTRVISSPRTHQDEISLLWQGLRSQGNSWWKPSKRTTKMHQERLQALANRLPALSSQTYGSYKSSSLVKQNAYPLPWSCLFLNIPNSDHTILPRQSKMSNILGSLRSFKFFENRIQMGYIKLDRKH